MSKRNVKQRSVPSHSRTKSRLEWRPWAFGAILLLVLGTAVWFLKPALWPNSLAPAEGAANFVEIQADMSGLYPKVIQAKVGEPLTVRLVSLDNQFHIDGGGKHGFAIDELGVDLVAPPLGSVETTFTPTKPGEYEFYCDICCGGRANPSMQGKLIVEL